MKTLGLARLSLAAAFCVAGSASAQPTISCPVNWDGMTVLDGAGPRGLEQLVYGVAVQDWKPDYLDLALQRHEQCERASGKPDSLRQAEQRFAQERAAMLKGYLQTRDGAVRQDEAARNSQRVPAESGSRQVQAAAQTGALILNFMQPSQTGAPAMPVTMTCSDLASGPDWTWMPFPAQDQLTRFHLACTQASQVPSEVEERSRRRAEDSVRWRQEAFGVIGEVEALASRPQSQNHAAVSAIEARWRYDGSTEPRVLAAAKKLGEIRGAVNERACPAHDQRSGIPNDLLAGMYLLEWASPVPLRWFACAAARKGTQVTYRKAGLISGEALLLRGRQDIDIEFKRDRMPDGAALAVPVTAKMNGQTYSIGRANIQQLAHNIRLALGAQ